MANSIPEIEALAAEIGENIYIDVAKWHLYLSQAQLHTPLAEKFYPLLEEETVSEEAIMKILRATPVALGGGKIEISLADLLPTKCLVALIDLLEEFQKNR